jgi:16S rRNA (cytosine1402-N4)-methyltransferase
VNDSQFLHKPVLMEQILEKIRTLAKFLSHTPQKVPLVRCCDATLGGAGHATACLSLLLELLPAETKIEFVGFDRDADARNSARERLLQLNVGSAQRFQFDIIASNFSAIESELKEKNWLGNTDFLLADFGVSSPQLDRPERGFSFQKEGPLDMRMDPSQGPTCAELLSELNETELADIFFRFGEEPRSRKLASAIVKDRTANKLPMSNTLEFASYVERVLGYHGSKVHPATRIFQALRIAVNGELDAIESLMEAIPRLLSPNGCGAFISFHSLEDRRVKQWMRAWEKGRSQVGLITDEAEQFSNMVLGNTPTGWGKELPRGGESASAVEHKENPRARSARLRTFWFRRNLQMSGS